MRDDPAIRSAPLPVVVQPDLMLDEQPVGWFRVGLTILGAAFVVFLVMYGLSRPPEPQQMAAASQAGARTNGSGQAQPGNAPAPSTTGQSQSEQSQGKSPRADSAVGGKITAPSDKAAQPGK